MKKIRVAINGFGRIGRTTMRLLVKSKNIEVIAINDIADTTTLAHLFKYDSVHGVFQGTVTAEANCLIVDDKVVYTYSTKEPTSLPWKVLKIDVVLESTGLFKTLEGATKHLTAGAKKVIISAPPQSEEIKSVVLGINEHILDGTETIISNASCTTNCAAPLISVLDDICDIESGYITTIHSYTGDQRLHDAPHKDLRRARAAAVSIVPTTTGAAKAITKIIPHLDGKMGGCGIRVPVANGSLTDITCIVNKTHTVEYINAAFKKASEEKLKGILSYTEDPIVSVDIINNPYSCIFDTQLTSVVDKMVKVVGWYDNESGYSNRLVELIGKIG